MSYVTPSHLMWLKAAFNSSTESFGLIYISWVATVSFHSTFYGSIQNRNMISVIKENLGKNKITQNCVLWIRDCEACFIHICFSFISCCGRSLHVQLTKGNIWVLLGAVFWKCYVLSLSARLNGWQHFQQLDFSTAHCLCLLVFGQCEWTSGICACVQKVRTENLRDLLPNEPEDEVCVGLIVLVEWVRHA